MEKVTLSISPLPPFVAINVDIPIEKIVKGYQQLSSKHYDLALTLNWALEKVLQDQWTEEDTDAVGSWSIRYPEYLSFFYHPKPLPNDISFKDTISFSAWIVRPLLSFIKYNKDVKLKNAILPRIYHYKEYLINHFDKKKGGFGLTRYSSDRVKKLALDIRHSAWALLTLVDLKDVDYSINEELFTRTGKYLLNEFQDIDEPEERASTYAVMHQIITNEKTKILVSLNEHECIRIQKSIELALINKYDKYYSSWDLEIKDKNRIKIIMAVFILMSMDIDKIVEDELSELVLEAIDTVISYMIRLDNDKMALPFVEGGNADIGITIQFFSILTKNKSLSEKYKKIINCLANYIFDSKTINTDFQFAYPFHISQIFYYAGNK